MNIFILDQTPASCAAAHCDQHIHKMILESAQMISTAMSLRHFNPAGLYKPAYQKHPCTQWAAESNHNIIWLCELALELEAIRTIDLNCPEHSSTQVIKIAKDYLEYEFGFLTSAAHTPFAFAGPAMIKIRNWDIQSKYRQYYRQKHQQWLLDKGAGMSYKHRPVPEFMADFLAPSA